MDKVKVVEQKVLVQCRKTGEWYNPQEQFNKLMNSSDMIAMFKRMAAK